MKKLFLFFVIIIVNINVIYAVKPIIENVEKQSYVEKKEFVNNLDLNDILNLTPKSYEKATGKKMKLREKIGLKIAKKIIKRKLKKAEKKKKRLKKKGKSEELLDGVGDTIGLLSMIFGILGFILFFVPGISALIGVLFAIAGFVMGLIGLKDSNANKLFRILGIVFGGLVIFLLLLGIIFIASLV